ncbi:cytochrome c biogenesis protein DipZ [Pandoraea pulmonicola]|uniref:Cytochrome C biogenesis protein n=1 Tax=Pandoraea pulmonicola TaxID=93221 RepID=A0AAJ5D293_PANPU|nr:cytochrome c biogenesis protein DipZ [Pandoraea pulmonicola]AJC19561.1 cytochrome C biogenesis protein [Pandoraea pulmonicola]SUA92360.1 thiol-disulfide oxidoreductase [Pandoraea pulmonicola]
MTLLILAYLGGILTIVSPCILPVLPFVFSRAGQSFSRSVLPMLAGMVLMFALVATLAAVGGNWVVQANRYGRWLALVLVALFGATLLFPKLAERLTHPLVSLGDRLSQSARHDGSQAADAGTRPGASFLLGIATGLLWAPCAGPILGLLLTGAALQGASIGTTLLLIAYAAGAATSLALALLVGGRVFTAMKRSLGAGEWIRRVLGGLMLAGVAAIALGLDTGVLARISTASTGGIEQKLVEQLGGRRNPANAMLGNAPADASADMNANATNSPAMPAASNAMVRTAAGDAAPLPVEGRLPSLDGAVQWLNSPPLTTQALRGKVVLVDFWTYSCINCLRTLPYVKAWAQKYRDQGLVVIGVHAPEFAFERDIGNVKKAVADLGVDYPVAIDNNYAIWRGFNNQYWPAHYFVDAQGRVRYHHFGEGNYAESERVIQQLLREAGARQVASGIADVQADGVQQAADMRDVRSPETYVGYARAENFASPGGTVRDQASDYRAPAAPALNAWGLAGGWRVGAEQATATQPGARIVYRFHARDLHLVLGPDASGKPVRFRVSVDGEAPGDAHGTDVAADGTGTVTSQRLYQLVRQRGEVRDRTFSIEFLDPGVSAYAFTFG